jgi:hypothetical protein
MLKENFITKLLDLKDVKVKNFVGDETGVVIVIEYPV